MTTRRSARRPLTVALVGALLVVSPGAAGADAGIGTTSGAETGVVLAGFGLRVVPRTLDGSITFVGGARPLTPPAERSPEEIAEGFVDRFAGLHGLGDLSDLTTESAVDAIGGGRAVRFQQEVDGVPVLGGELVVRVDDDGRVRSSAGELVTDDRLDAPAAPVLDTSPDVTRSEAAATALALTARAEGVPADELRVDPPELWIFDPVLVDAPGAQRPRLVWRTAVRDAIGAIDRAVLVDAHRGQVVLEYSQVHAADSQVCDNANVARTTYAQADCPSATQTVARSDATGVSAVQEVERAYQLSEAVLAFYLALGRDSIDGLGMTVRSTVRICFSTSCPYGNAYWDGAQMVYGTGYASADDVVGHELTHGVTQYESNLMYYAESGAINESLSDVFGELFDLSYDSAWDDDSAGAAWLMGEDLPPGVGPIRDMADPTVFGNPDRMTSPYYWGLPGDSYGVHVNSGVNNKAAYLIATGGTFNGRTMVGLGNTKTAAVYYEAQTSLLTAGSDHLDLFHALPQACANLAGPAGTPGTAGIVSADCTTVTLAVQATEMNLAPVTAGARRTADDCPAGQVVGQVLAQDTMESGSGWTAASSRQDQQGQWIFTTASSQSGVRALFGPDPAVLVAATATRSSSIAVPGAGTYLRFDHSYSFDTSTSGNVSQYWDGGQVRLLVNGGAATDVTALGLPAVYGYTGTLTSSGNVATGQQAFVGQSPGYQRTHYDLSSLAGSSFRLQFRTVTDASVGGDGWAIDDVTVYTCVAAPSGSTTSTSSTTTTVPAAPSVTVPPATVPPEPGLTAFAAVEPSRVVDTRGESPNAMRQVPRAQVTPSLPLRVRMSGLPGGATPADGVGAVAVNVVATGSRAAGYVTVYPCGDRSLVSSLNFEAGATVANAVVAPVSVDGDVCFAVSTPTDLVVDLNGWFPRGDAFHAVGPARVLDTRGESPNALVQVAAVPLGPDRPLEVAVTGLPGGVTPPTGIAAVSLNVTITEPRSAGFLTVYPCGERPFVASVNFDAAQTVANAVIAPVSDLGRLCFFSSTPTELVVDVNGWIGEGAPFHAVGPGRVLDTRGESPNALRNERVRPVRPDDPLEVSMVDLGSLVPPSGVGSVSLNVTVVSPGEPGFVTAYPCGSRPFVSSVNYARGRTVSNAVIATLSADGRLCFFASSPVDLVVDVNGWFPT